MTPRLTSPVCHSPLPSVPPVWCGMCKARFDAETAKSLQLGGCWIYQEASGTIVYGPDDVVLHDCRSSTGRPDPRSSSPDNGRVVVIRDCRIVNSSEGDGDLNHVVIRLTRRPPVVDQVRSVVG